MSKPDISDLQLQLEQTRELVIALLPEQARRIVEPRFALTIDEVITWHSHTVERVIELAEPKPDFNQQDRAPCPLCRRGPEQGVHDGFTVPEGLRRHLEGSHNFHRCEVMAVAYTLTKNQRRQ
jgi:hypothetical protein